jgi:AcrR family transcriptional regulator
MAREYSAPGRAEQAQATRRRIVEAARRLLLDGGYAKMTIAELARAAEVSPQTVYNSVGGKAEVVKAVYDVTLAGDDDPVPMSDRPEFRAVVEAEDIATWARAYAHRSRTISQRVGPLLAVLLGHGAAGDPVLEAFVAKIDGERRIGNRMGLSGLVERDVVPSGRTLDRIVDAVWVLTAPETYDRLVLRSGWSASAYESWLSGQLVAALEGSAGR